MKGLQRLSSGAVHLSYLFGKVPHSQEGKENAVYEEHKSATLSGGAQMTIRDVSGNFPDVGTFLPFYTWTKQSYTNPFEYLHLETKGKVRVVEGCFGVW